MYQLEELSPNAPSLRISPEVDVPATARVKRIIDSRSFRRLSRISQLGLVSLVYPGATHTRFEHSLGVFRNAVLFLQQLQNDSVFLQHIDEHAAKCFLLAALLHDIGHWPYCHTTEDLKLEEIPHHELIAKQLLNEPPLADLLMDDWGVRPDEVANILSPEKELSPTSPVMSILHSMLSGPIDIDKLDYLERDSLHAGVPYGRNFDRNRLIRSLCIHPDTLQLAITEKGKTAAEMMVFARYVMFSEVYWHHAVRASTAMLQRAIYELFHADDSSMESPLGRIQRWVYQTDIQMSDELEGIARGKPWEACVSGIFGLDRKLYKRVGQFDYLDEPELHRSLAGRPFCEIVSLSNCIGELIAQRGGIHTPDGTVLLDAPPLKREVQFQMDVRLSRGAFRPLGALSPMVQALATKQFDDIVKRVRVFAAPEVAVAVRQRNLDIRSIVAEAIGRTSS